MLPLTAYVIMGQMLLFDVNPSPLVQLDIPETDAIIIPDNQQIIRLGAKFSLTHATRRDTRLLVCLSFSLRSLEKA